MTDRDTIQGLRFLIVNATLQTQRLLDLLAVDDMRLVAMEIGWMHRQITKKACKLAAWPSKRSEPVLRKLARKSRGK